MKNPFSLSDDDLKTLLAAYTTWSKKGVENSGYAKEQEERQKSIKQTLLDKSYLAGVPDDDLVAKILEYCKTLEGPAGIRIGVPRVTEELGNIKRNLDFLIQSPEDPFDKAARILEGDYKIPVFAKAFWTPLFQAQYPDTLPNWNNKTERFLKRVGINLKTSKLTIEKKYRLISDAFVYLQRLDSSQTFFTLNHLMHYGTVIDEGVKLLNQLIGKTDYNGDVKTRYWQIAPAEKGRLWKDFRASSIAAVGYNEMDVDLTGLSKEELFDTYRKAYPTHSKGKVNIQAGQLWKFINIQPGEKLIANRGEKKLLAAGLVKSGYKFRPERKEYRHTIDVEWYKVDDTGIPIPENLKGKFGKTIVPLKPAEFLTLEGLLNGGKDDRLEKVQAWIGNLKTFVTQDGKLPYKPLLLASVLNLAEEQPGRERTFRYDELYSEFSRLLGNSGFSISESQFCQPYARMTYDSNPLQVWEPQMAQGESLDDSKCHLPSYVKETMPSARINEAVWSVFSSSEGRNITRQEILRRWPGLEWLFKKRVVPPYSIQEMARESGLEEGELGRWIRAIERKGQAVIYGPPGTGKTFVAESLARHLVGGGHGFVELVQFHPAYAYEDFVQGIRPKAREDGGLAYPVVPGRFLDFCKRAEGRQDRCVLIIDEINRANLARVFGELMYLLEYRNREVPLASGGSLRIPKNVRMIGTMNTADRSIALVDHALRRRFAFLALYSNYEVLRKYHKDNDFNVEPLINLLSKLNKEIGDRHYEVGISFFLRMDLSDQIEDIWRMEIEPYLEEYFFDQRDKTEAFRWEKVGKEIL